MEELDQSGLTFLKNKSGKNNMQLKNAMWETGRAEGVN